MNLSFAKKINGDTWEEKLQTTIECTCCIRHNINKPKHLAPWIELSFNNTNISQGDCLCPCRHHARFICRIFETNSCPKYSEWKKKTHKLSQVNSCSDNSCSDYSCSDYLTD